MEAEKHYKIFFVALAGAVVLAGLVLAAAFFYGKNPLLKSLWEYTLLPNQAVNSPANPKATATPTATTSAVGLSMLNLIIVNDQKLGAAVNVNQVSLMKPGFVVVKKKVSEGNYKIVAVSQYLSAGVYNNLKVDLYSEQYRPKLAASDSLLIKMYADINNNKKFDGEDFKNPLLNSTGAEVAVIFKLL